VKLLIKLFLWVAGVYLVVVLGSGLLIKAMLSGGRIQTLVRSLNERAPVAISVAEGSFDLVEWFRFRPVVTLSRIAIANPPGFSSRPMIEAREAGAQVALFSLFQDSVRLMRVSLREPVVNIETGPKGNTNAATVVMAKTPGGAGQEKGKSVSIDSLSVTGGTVLYQGQAAGKGLAVRDIELSLSDFGAGKRCQVTLGARLFGGKTSRVDFKGGAGPAGTDSLPAQGSLSVVIAPAEVPRALRDEYLGDLLREPPPAARAAFTAAMDGDLLKTLAGTGELQLTDFAVGRSQQARLTLAGKAPLRLAFRGLLGSPSLEVTSPGASLQLGQGRWKGSLAARYDAGRLSGQSSGSITGVKIDEMLRAFTAAKDPVSGMAEMPEYRIQFAGTNAVQIRDSLAGDGRIIVRDGKVGLFDLVGTIEAKLNSLLGGDTGKAGTTDFLKLATRFEIKNGRVTLPDLVLESSSSSVGGQGYFGFDNALSFDLATDITGALAAKLGGRPDSAGTAHLRVPVRVRGTLQSPKVYPDVAGMAKATAVEKAKGLLDSFLKKRTAAPAK